MSEVTQIELSMKKLIVYNKKPSWIVQVVKLIWKKIERTPSNMWK